MVQKNGRRRTMDLYRHLPVEAVCLEGKCSRDGWICEGTGLRLKS